MIETKDNTECLITETINYTIKTRIWHTHENGKVTILVYRNILDKNTGKHNYKHIYTEIIEDAETVLGDTTRSL